MERGALLLLGVVGLVLPRPASACGGGVVTESGSIGADAHRVFMSVRANGTDVVTQIGVPATTEAYGVLIPVGALPTLDPDPVDTEELDLLEEATAPTIEQGRRTGGSSDDGGGCGCPFPGGSASDDKSGGAGGDGDSDKVTVTRPVAIGPVTAVVVGGMSPEAITAWLADNGFSLPQAAQERVGEYVGTDRHFIALRRTAGAPSGGPTSVGVHFWLEGDRRGIPLRLASLGATGTVAFTVFVAAQTTSAPAPPFTPLTIDDLDPETLAGGGYGAAVEAAVSDRAGRAFVLESDHVATEVIPTGSLLSSLVDSGQRLTRLSTILAVETMTEDVRLDATFTSEVPSLRVLGQETSGAPPALPVSGTLALVVAAFRRRKRAARTR